MQATMKSNYPGLVFSTQWYKALSEDAVNRMPWEIHSMKGGVWRLYYRAKSVTEANDMAIGLRDARGKAPHVHAIRVVNWKTHEKGIELPALKEKHEKKEEKKNANP